MRRSGTGQLAADPVGSVGKALKSGNQHLLSAGFKRYTQSSRVWTMRIASASDRR